MSTQSGSGLEARVRAVKGVRKVGLVTDDGKTISPHFGRAQLYLVYTIEDGKVTSKETRPKAFHQAGGSEHHEGGGDHHRGPEAARMHGNMLSNVSDCEALIARGMGTPMYEAIVAAGITPFLTMEALADEAVEAYLKGQLDDNVQRLH